MRPLATTVLFAAIGVSHASTVPKCPDEKPLPFPIFFPYPDNCAEFYHCSEGVAYLKTCPQGLLFNINLDSCDHPGNVDCGDRKILLQKGR